MSSLNPSLIIDIDFTSPNQIRDCPQSLRHPDPLAACSDEHGDAAYPRPPRRASLRRAWTTLSLPND